MARPTCKRRTACRSTRSAQPARSLLTEEHCSSGNTVTSRRSFETRFRKTRASSYPFLADAGSRPGNCSGMEEATGAPSSFADWDPKWLRASGRDGG